ncbi:hypothetical protein [Virgibacillus siamensis]|uniref:hypothetical protein n=1 Tax=Virgibacillus siamensis TaxID=480071 RepID=UPI00158EF8C6|nr:hypothetical protein [Virgibacillus siamensis]
MELLEKEKFLKKYNIDKEEFEKLSITWEQLLDIFKDYLEFNKVLTPTANTIAEILRAHPDVHTVRSRIKDPEHLIEKIIRKIIVKKEDKDFKITIENYKELITDLIGIRVLHLYKDQASSIDEFIQGTWPLQETATIYYRKGDNVTLDDHKDESKYNLKEHPAGYRSWHYLIKTNLTKVENIAEIQVRTIFEEGWSEVDHQLRYPYDLDNALLKDQLLVLNRVAGSADEMANAIRETKLGLGKLVDENEEYKRKIGELSQKLEKALKDKTFSEELVKDLQEKVDDLNPKIHFSNNFLTGSNSSNYLTNPRSLTPRDMYISDSYKIPRDSTIKVSEE